MSHFMLCLSCSTAAWTVVSGLHLTPSPGNSVVRKDARQFKRPQDRGLLVDVFVGVWWLGRWRMFLFPSHLLSSATIDIGLVTEQLHTTADSSQHLSAQNYEFLTGHQWHSQSFACTVLSFIPWLQQSYPFLDKNLRSSLSPITPVPASRHHKVFCSHSRPYRKRQSHSVW